MIKFIQTLLLMPKPWLVWIGLLLAANMLGALFFISTPEAQATLGALLLSAGIQTYIFSKKGFVRLLGVHNDPNLRCG